MQIKLIFTIFIMLALISGCTGEPRYNGSSEKAFGQSKAKVEAALSSKEKEKLGKAITMIMFEDVGDDNLFGGLAKMASMASSGALGSELMAKLDGKTATEVIQMASEIEQRKFFKNVDKRREELDKARQALLDIEKQEHADKIGREELKKLIIVPVEYKWEDKGIVGWIFTVQTKVTNGTSKAIQSISAHVRLYTPGRTIPWTEGDISETISGGIEPGETTIVLMRKYGGYSGGPYHHLVEGKENVKLGFVLTNARDAEGKYFANALSEVAEESQRTLKGLYRQQIEDLEAQFKKYGVERPPAAD